MNDKQIIEAIKQSQIKGFVSRFEPLLYVPAFTTVKDFHYPLLDSLQRDLTIRNYKHSEYTTP